MKIASNVNIAVLAPKLLRRLHYSTSGAARYIDAVDGTLDPRQRRCWLCNNASPRPTFRRRAHVVPEALGNRSLLSSEECDWCNHFTGQHDSALIASTAPYRVTSPHRRRPVVFRDPETRSAIRSLDDTKNVIVTESSTASPLVKELSATELKVQVPVDAYRPLSICKSLARLALMLCPEVRPEHDHVRRWILGHESWEPQLLFSATTIAGGVFEPSVFVFKDWREDSGDTSIATLFIYDGLFYWYAIPKHAGAVSATFFDRTLFDQLSGQLEWEVSFVDEKTKVAAHHAVLTLVHGGRRETDRDEQPC